MALQTEIIPQGDIFPILDRESSSQDQKQTGANNPYDPQSPDSSNRMKYGRSRS
jgi:hypothetical protein